MAFVNTEMYVTCILVDGNTLKISTLFSLLFLFQSEILHEAEVMMKLDHPNIVRIIGTVISNYYMATIVCTL